MWITLWSGLDNVGKKPEISTYICEGVIHMALLITFVINTTVYNETFIFKVFNFDTL